jgi:UPF0176 protein
MNTKSHPITVAALYHFVPLQNLDAIRLPLLALCQDRQICGTILLASEGVNGTIAGEDAAISEVLDHIRNWPGCSGLEVKFSHAPEMPFLRMKVRLKKEIVTMGVADIDAAHEKGQYVDSLEWNDLIADPDTVLIDTRNDYEVEMGSFDKAINPQTTSFRDFPRWFDQNADQWRAQGKKIAMYCTGGIRCEKATAYVKKQGFEDVFHLKGGILKYLENVPADQSLFDGECFVFDQRVGVGHGLVPSEAVQCHACRRPLTAQDVASKDYEPGVSCPKCIDVRSETERNRYRERQHQIDLAAKRGEKHLGS